MDVLVRLGRQNDGEVGWWDGGEGSVWVAKTTVTTLLITNKARKINSGRLIWLDAFSCLTRRLRTAFYKVSAYQTLTDRDQATILANSS